MIKSETAVIPLQVDVSEASLNIAEVGNLLESLKGAAEETGRAIAQAFSQSSGELLQVKLGIENTVNAFLAFDKGVSEIEKLSGKLNKYVKAANEASSVSGFLSNILPDTSGVISGIQDLSKKIKIPFSDMASSFQNMFGGLSLGWGAVIAVVVAAVIALVVLIVQNWDKIKAVFATVAEWFNTNVIQPVVGFFTGLWTNIVNIATKIWNGIVAVFTGIGQWVYDNVIVPIMNFLTPLLQWHIALWTSIWQTVCDVFNNIVVIIQGCWQVIQLIWQVVAEWFNTNVIQPVVGFFTGLWADIVAMATAAWAGIQAVFTTIAVWLDTNVVQPVATFFTDMWSSLISGATEAWEGIKSVFSTVANFFGQIFSEAWQKVVSVFSVAGEIFVSIRDGILTAFKSIVNGIIRGLNQVVSVPFNGINAALGMIRGIEILGARPFSGIGTITVPQIPLLAQGAVLPANRPFLAVVGDQRNGTNVEAPLATIQEALANVLGQQGGQDIRITFTGDLAQLARVLKPAIERENRRTGGSLAKGVVV